MNEKHLDDLLKSHFSEKPEPDERLKAQIRRKARERSEKRNNILLCFIQSAMLLLTIAIAAAVLVFAPGTLIPALIIGGILTGNVICIVGVLFQSNTK